MSEPFLLYIRSTLSAYLGKIFGHQYFGMTAVKGGLRHIWGGRGTIQRTSLAALGDTPHDAITGTSHAHNITTSWPGNGDSFLLCEADQFEPRTMP